MSAIVQLSSNATPRRPTLIMRHFHIALLLSAASMICVDARPCIAETRPNVVVIYTDDQGSLDANCYGSKDLDTPNIDKLASQGIRFTQMYSPSGICSASRAGLMTGRFPARAGVPGNVSSAHGQAGMPTSEITIAELLKSAGYVTGHVGKWHLGYTPETMPNGQGYDYSFGHMGGCIDNFSHFFYWNGPNRHDLWRNGKEIFRDGEFFLDLMVDEGKSFINDNQTKPFFLYWAINAPHYPMQGSSKWRERYKDLPSPRRQYAEFVSTVDEKIGELVSTLDQLGLRENTLVVVQSDHGHSTEERAFWGGGNSGPYRGAKGCLFEGGIRVPSVVTMPGTIPAGEVRDQTGNRLRLVSHHRTVVRCELAGQKVRRQEPTWCLEGRRIRQRARSFLLATRRRQERPVGRPQR